MKAISPTGYKGGRDALRIALEPATRSRDRRRPLQPPPPARPPTGPGLPISERMDPMSVETETRLTDAATAFRVAKFEFDHCTLRHGEAVRELRRADHTLGTAEANLMDAEELLERRAGDPAIQPEEIQEAARLLKAARIHFTQQKDIHLRLTAAVADRDEERLRARHAAAQARAVLYEEATHA